MRNVRDKLAAALRHPVPDPLWRYLQDEGYASEVEEDIAPIGYLVEKAGV